MESIEHFFSRCKGWLEDIVPKYSTREEDVLSGQIIARRGGLYLVTSGYSEETPDGPVYSQAVLVDFEKELAVVGTASGPVAVPKGGPDGPRLRVQHQ